MWRLPRYHEGTENLPQGLNTSRAQPSFSIQSLEECSHRFPKRKKSVWEDCKPPPEVFKKIKLGMVDDLRGGSRSSKSLLATQPVRGPHGLQETSQNTRGRGEDQVVCHARGYSNVRKMLFSPCVG